VQFQTPGAAVPDGDGGYTQGWADLDPATMFVAITAATQAAIERRTPAGASIATATHLITGPFHPGVTTKTRILFDGREFHVNAVTDVDEAGVEMILTCTELVA
jgi:SPP1 family predicted phage head-tail adaptor